MGGWSLFCLSGDRPPGRRAYQMQGCKMRGSRTLALPFVMQGPCFWRLLDEARPCEFGFALGAPGLARARPEKRQGGCQDGAKALPERPSCKKTNKSFLKQL